MTQRDAIAEFSPAEQRPGWPVIGMSLVAMAALYFSSGGYLGLVVLALALMGSRFFAGRIPRRRLYEWLAERHISIEYLPYTREISSSDIRAALR